MYCDSEHQQVEICRCRLCKAEVFTHTRALLFDNTLTQGSHDLESYRRYHLLEHYTANKPPFIQSHHT